MSSAIEARDDKFSSTPAGSGQQLPFAGRLTDQAHDRLQPDQIHFPH